jgi:hypothetical protein
LKRPSGGITSMVTPGRMHSLAQVENRPPFTRLMATRRRLSCTAEQIE